MDTRVFTLTSEGRQLAQMTLMWCFAEVNTSEARTLQSLQVTLCTTVQLCQLARWYLAYRLNDVGSKIHLRFYLRSAYRRATLNNQVFQSVRLKTRCGYLGCIAVSVKMLF
jgi:hypothetical protein